MLSLNNSSLIVIDVQEKLTSMLKIGARRAEEKCLKIVKAANILNLPIILTEQYPKGLGETIPDIKNALGSKYKPFEKTYFSAVKEKAVDEAIKKTGRKQAVIIGIEAHICVFQTALELKEKGFEVFVVQDAVFSRFEEEKEAALQNLRHLGISTYTLEMVLFSWLEGSKHPNFKEVQALIK